MYVSDKPETIKHESESCIISFTQQLPDVVLTDKVITLLTDRTAICVQLQALQSMLTYNTNTPLRMSDTECKLEFSGNKRLILKIMIDGLNNEVLKLDSQLQQVIMEEGE